MEHLKIKATTRKLPVAAALLASAMLAGPHFAAAQTCSLCYSRASSSGARMIQALRSGILVLIVPPTSMSVGMIFIVYRKRNQVRPSDDSDASRADNW